MVVISLVFASAPTEASDLTEEETFYGTLDSVVDQCPGQDTLFCLGGFQCIDLH